jgi:hypothetical protein
MTSLQDDVCDTGDNGARPRVSKLKFGHAAERIRQCFSQFLNATLSLPERAFIDVAQL